LVEPLIGVPIALAVHPVRKSVDKVGIDHNEPELPLCPSQLVFKRVGASLAILANRPLNECSKPVLAASRRSTPGPFALAF
jgi:hypothetical protein